MYKIALASKSPRRIQLLNDYGMQATPLPADIVEKHPINCDYISTVMHLALKKAMYVYTHENITGYDLIIGSDTIVYNDEILEKPSSKDDAYKMIKSLAGHEHIVATGIAIIDINNGKKYVSHVDTLVYVNDLTENEINEYINTEEPYDKAGAYAIQGIFGKHIEKYEGSYTNVMGLPMEKLQEMLKSI
ncbi:MAG: septum formation protein Maf [Peptostreptococcaceae bacterium]|nr:septum formation protein Maf [Peptostreptococcaceae bacterium]